MKIIFTITVVANLILAGVKVARQSEAITCVISRAREGLMCSGLRGGSSPPT